MTSHVAQFFVTAQTWQRTLADLKRALVPGGRLTFDSRDPRARKWEDWNPVDSRRQITLADGGEVTAWTEVTQVKDRVVDFTIHYLMPTGDELTSEGTLAFRTEDEVRIIAHRGRLHDRAHLRRLEPRPHRLPRRRIPGRSHHLSQPPATRRS